MITDEDPRFRHLKRKVSGFVALALALVCLVVFFIGREHDLFTQKYELCFTVEKGTGFTRGMPVKLSGFRIGRVKSISLNESATVDIVLQIDSRYQKWIHSDSRARLQKEGLVGDMIVDVSVGSATTPLLRHQDRLAFEKTKGLDELADEIAEKVKPVLVQIRDIIEYVNDPKGDLKQSFRNIHALSAQLEDTRRHADELLGSGTTAVNASAARVDRLLTEADSRLKELAPALAHLEKSGATLEQRLPPLLEKLDGTVGNLLEISRTTAATSSRVMPRIPPMVDNAEETLDRGNRLLEGVSGVWPLSSAVPPPVTERLVPGDGHE
jgi:phospholipid/cholesterol/gamma-HCH transport system substrate-binding protein